MYFGRSCRSTTTRSLVTQTLFSMTRPPGKPNSSLQVSQTSYRLLLAIRWRGLATGAIPRAPRT